MIVLMALITLVPLFLMALVNRYQYEKTLNLETIEPLRIRMNDAKRSFEMFVSQRKSALGLISSIHDLDELLDERTLARTLTGLKRDIGGFVDLGVVDSERATRTSGGSRKWRSGGLTSVKCFWVTANSRTS
jgi:two-component system NtrC family sensor kinase